MMTYHDLFDDGRSTVLPLVTHSWYILRVGRSLQIGVRPFFAVMTAIFMAIALFLGLYPSMGQYLPLSSDKILHFAAFATMTFLSSWSIVVQDDSFGQARHWLQRWIWCHFAAWMVASVVSEFLQALLPSKTFQYGDILANILGTMLGSIGAAHMQLHHVAEASEYRLLDTENRGLEAQDNHR